MELRIKKLRYHVREMNWERITAQFALHSVEVDIQQPELPTVSRSYNLGDVERAAGSSNSYKR